MNAGEPLNFLILILTTLVAFLASFSRYHQIMGKRKSASKPAPKRETPKLAKVFNCPFCNHEDSVEVRLDRIACIGTIACRICNAEYRIDIDNLSEPVDVYAAWIDEAERLNNLP